MIQASVQIFVHRMPTPPPSRERGASDRMGIDCLKKRVVNIPVAGRVVRCRKGEDLYKPARPMHGES